MPAHQIPVVENVKQKKTILVVDDEPMLNELLCRQIKKSGHLSLTAKCGNDALKLVETDPTVDVVISDVRMPNGDGVYLLEQCKAVRPELPFLLMTGYTDLPTAEAFAKGASTVLHKPFDLTTIISTLEDAAKTTEERLATEKTAEDFDHRLSELAIDPEFGRGGFMIKLPVSRGILDQSDLWFTVQFGDQKIEGHGTAVWTRTDLESMQQKVGIRIDGLTKESIQTYLDRPTSENLISFIPYEDK